MGEVMIDAFFDLWETIANDAVLRRFANTPIFLENLLDFLESLILVHDGQFREYISLR